MVRDSFIQTKYCPVCDYASGSENPVAHGDVQHVNIEHGTSTEDDAFLNEWVCYECGSIGEDWFEIYSVKPISVIKSNKCPNCGEYGHITYENTDTFIHGMNSELLEVNWTCNNCGAIGEDLFEGEFTGGDVTYNSVEEGDYEVEAEDY